MFLRLLISKAPWKTLKYSLHQRLRILSLWSRWNYFCKLNPCYWLLSDNLPLFTTTFSRDTRFKFFLPPWRIYRCVTANMKTIKTQSEPNPSYFPIWSLREDSSVTAPTDTWPTLRKQSIVQAKEVYSKCLVGINLVNRGQAWLKIAETSGYILSLIYVYSIWSLYQEFFLFVKTTEHLTNDHEKIVFLHKQIGYF